MAILERKALAITDSGIKDVPWNGYTTSSQILAVMAPMSPYLELPRALRIFSAT